MNRVQFALCFVLGSTVSARGESAIFWADANVNSGQVGRAALDGAATLPLFGGLPAPRDVAVDPYTADIYWTDASESYSVRRGRADGAGGEHVITNIGAPGSVAVDSELGYLFWTTPTGVFRAATDGSHPEQIVAASSVTSVEIDHLGKSIYYTDIWNGEARIRRANLDGSLPTTIVTDSRFVRDFAVDPWSGHVYYVLYDQLIRRANLDGSGAIVDAVETGIEASIKGIAVDIRHRKLYWTNRYTASEQIQSANLDGGNLNTVVTAVSDPRGIAIGPTSPVQRGDTDGDGDVDFDDLNAVRNHFGIGEFSVMGDTAPFDGDVDLDDLNVVRDHFGEATRAAPVPEPPALFLFAVGVAGFAAIFRRHCRPSQRQTTTGP